MAGRARQRLLARLRRHPQNVAFSELEDLVAGLGFRLSRITGSHHTYSHPEIPGRLNLQPRNGQAKAYQVRQLLRLVEEYNLRLEDEE